MDKMDRYIMTGERMVERKMSARKELMVASQSRCSTLMPHGQTGGQGGESAEGRRLGVKLGGSLSMGKLRSRLSQWLHRGGESRLQRLQCLFTAHVADVAANKLAAAWIADYSQADELERQEMLTAVAEISTHLVPRGDAGLRFFKRLYAQADSLLPLVQWRADALRWRKQVEGLGQLEQELESLLSAWFDVGMLEMRRITWDSAASLLEKLIHYEAVHEIQSWEALRHRVADPRHCYAFFHPRMAGVPLIFVQVAFDDQMSANVQALLDPKVPAKSALSAKWAIFYSISNTQAGLRGISFGNFLLKRVVQELMSEAPAITRYATLSPIPGFAQWLARCDAQRLYAALPDRLAASLPPYGSDAGAMWVERLAQAARGATPTGGLEESVGRHLAAHYVQLMKDGAPLDPVARFHLGNGARIDRINWAADASEKGLKQSCGLMVNYVYELEQLDANLRQLAEGRPRTGRLLRGR